MLKTTFSAITALLVSSVSLANEVVTNPTWDLDRLDQTTTSLDGQYVKPPVRSECKTLHVVTVQDDTPELDTLLTSALNSCVDLKYYYTGYSYSYPMSGVISALDDVRSASSPGDVVLIRPTYSANSQFDSAVYSLSQTGVMIAVAAGSDNANACNYSPQRVSDIYTVGDSLVTDGQGHFNNYGSCIDAYAPASFSGAGAANAAATMANCGAANGIIDPIYMYSQMTAGSTSYTGIPIIHNVWCQ